MRSIGFRMTVSRRRDTVVLPCVVETRLEGGLVLRSEARITLQRRELADFGEAFGVTCLQLLPLYAVADADGSKVRLRQRPLRAEAMEFGSYYAIWGEVAAGHSGAVLGMVLGAAHAWWRDRADQRALV